MDHHDVLELLHSPEHECRLAALLIWTYQFARRSEPRTTLRYAIERFTPERRRAYLQGLA
jgi:hypothetical protein